MLCSQTDYARGRARISVGRWFRSVWRRGTVAPSSMTKVATMGARCTHRGAGLRGVFRYEGAVEDTHHGAEG